MDSTLVNLVKDVTLQGIESIKYGAPVVYEAAKQQVRADLISNSIISCILLSIILFCTYIVRDTIRKEKEDGYVDEMRLATRMLCIIIIVISIVFSAITLYTALMCYLSPDYAAMENIKQLLLMK